MGHKSLSILGMLWEGTFMRKCLEIVAPRAPKGHPICSMYCPFSEPVSLIFAHGARSCPGEGRRRPKSRKLMKIVAPMAPKSHPQCSSAAYFGAKLPLRGDLPLSYVLLESMINLIIRFIIPTRPTPALFLDLRLPLP